MKIKKPVMKRWYALDDGAVERLDYLSDAEVIEVFKKMVRLGKPFLCERPESPSHCFRVRLISARPNSRRRK
jgi:hypothetical protein